MKLRYYQEAGIDTIIKYHCDGGETAGNTIAALPTGTGKGPMIAGLIKRLFQMWPRIRILNLTHVKELIAQNADKLTLLWPEAPAGIYSAGLGQRDTMLPILFGGVASIVKSEAILSQHWDLGIIDECHLLSPTEDTMYLNIINAITARNPRFKVVGFTATPYRMKQGMLTDGGFFTDICYDLTGVEAFNRFITEGFLIPLIPKRTETFVDVSDVRIVGGDYAIGALDNAIDQILVKGLEETCEYGQYRHKWLIFTAGVKTADHAADWLNAHGIPARSVHSKKTDAENDESFRMHRAGVIRALVGMNKFTTGYDDPDIDLIAVFRKTRSPGLWVQLLGRGTRPSYMPGFDLESITGRLESIYNSQKQNCLVLDFAHNSEDLGPINDVRIPRKPGKATGDAPIRICSTAALLINKGKSAHEREKGCEAYNHASARYCCNCGREFLFETHLLQHSSTNEVIRADAEPVIEYFDVQRVFYGPHETEKGRSVRVIYTCGLRSFREYICIEHTSSLATKRGRDWFRQRFVGNGEEIEPPATVDEFLSRVSNLKEPKRLRVRTDKQYPEILGHEFF